MTDQINDSKAIEPTIPEAAATPPRRQRLGTILMVVAGLALIIGGVYLGQRLILRSNASEVGAITQDRIYQLEDFVNAQKQLKDYSDTLEKELEAASRTLQGEDLLRKRVELQKMLDEKRGKLLNPLLDRMRAAIAITAAKKKITVVLEEGIAIYGVPDITDSVIETYEKQVKNMTDEQLKKVESTTIARSPVGYFDQEVVASLMPFLELNQKLNQLFQVMARQLEVDSRGKSEQQRQALLERYNLQFQEIRRTNMAPLLNEVTEAVKAVAKEKGLSLVLDKQNVMYGGTNITDEVVERFLKTHGGVPSAAPTSGATGTPGAGGGKSGSPGQTIITPGTVEGTPGLYIMTPTPGQAAPAPAAPETP